MHFELDLLILTRLQRNGKEKVYDLSELHFIVHCLLSVVGGLLEYEFWLIAVMCSNVGGIN